MRRGLLLLFLELDLGFALSLVREAVESVGGEEAVHSSLEVADGLFGVFLHFLKAEVVVKDRVVLEPLDSPGGVWVGGIEEEG